MTLVYTASSLTTRPPRLPRKQMMHYTLVLSMTTLWNVTSTIQTEPIWLVDLAFHVPLNSYGYKETGPQFKILSVRLRKHDHAINSDFLSFKI